MEIEGSLPPDDPATVFYVGHHGLQRDAPVSMEVLGQTQSLGYDFATTPLTTASFHERVVSQLQGHLSEKPTDGHPLPLVSPLSPSDTSLTPNASNSALMGVVSPWVDLASPDPVIAHVSRQVLGMEVAFAAFCGIGNVIIHSPSTANGTTQYARAIAEALGLGPYVQMHVLLPMTGELETDAGEIVHLSELARSENVDGDDVEPAEDAAYDTWERWDVIRTVCNYSQKLSLGKTLPAPNIHSYVIHASRLHFADLTNNIKSVGMPTDERLADALLLTPPFLSA